MALTITHLLEKNLVTTYDAEKILWALLGSVYLYEVEEGKLVAFTDLVLDTPQ